MSRNNIQALKTVDGETLMSKPLQPLNFIVDTLLSQGLHILAGSPKVGKSWLALWLAVTVAKGDAVWGMPVKQGTTLYLCLEDSTLRVQTACLKSPRTLLPMSTSQRTAACSVKVWKTSCISFSRSIPIPYS